VSGADLRQRLQATGIGYAGIDGVWWQPAIAPFPLPATVANQLVQIGQAIFLLFDTVIDLYARGDAELIHLLNQRVPTPIPRWFSAARVHAVRPDFQMVRSGDSWHFVATELELCPSAHGFAHAMQVGYGLAPDLAAHYAAILQGRPLLFVGSAQWSEFILEQLAFCHALAEHGAQGYVLYDQPVATLAAEVQTNQRWVPPLFGVETLPAQWNRDLLGRIEQGGLTPYLWPHDETWPANVGDALIFRFGYFDCFAPAHLARMVDWQEQGATFLNPPTFFLDSKTVMAALQLPTVRRALAEHSSTLLSILDAAIPETVVVDETTVARIQSEQADWVIKFAGFDQQNQAWGGRSLQVGAQRSAAAWQQALVESLQLPWPVVAQKFTPSAQLDLAYYDENEQIRWLRQGATRLRAFLLRNPSQPTYVKMGGAHLTLVKNNVKVAEGLDAVQAPIQFLNSRHAYTASIRDEKGTTNHTNLHK